MLLWHRITCQGCDHIVSVQSGRQSLVIVNVHFEPELTLRLFYAKDCVSPLHIGLRIPTLWAGDAGKIALFHSFFSACSWDCSTWSHLEELHSPCDHTHSVKDWSHLYQPTCGWGARLLLLLRCFLKIWGTGPFRAIARRYVLSIQSRPIENNSANAFQTGCPNIPFLLYFEVATRLVQIKNTDPWLFYRSFLERAEFGRFISPSLFPCAGSLSVFWVPLLRIDCWDLVGVSRQFPGEGWNTTLIQFLIPRAVRITHIFWKIFLRTQQVPFGVLSWTLLDMALCFPFERKWLQENIERFMIFNKRRGWSHSSRVKFLWLPWLRVVFWRHNIRFGSWVKLFLSIDQSSATLWLLDTCLIVGLRPLMIIFCFIVFKNVQQSLTLRRLCVCCDVVHMRQFLKISVSLLFGVGFAISRTVSSCGIGWWFGAVWWP